MAQYKVINKTLSFSKPGISPTEKNGTDMGWVNVGFVFTPGAYQNGWLAIASNKWVKASDCQEVTVEPPPVDPPPAVMRQTRYSYDGGETWTAWETWEKRQNV